MEDGADGLEDHYIEHALNILFDHVADHVGIGHHLRHLIKLNLLFKIPSFFCAEVRFSLFDAMLRQKVGILSDTARSDHGTTMLNFIFDFFERGLNIQQLIAI